MLAAAFSGCMASPEDRAADDVRFLKETPPDIARCWADTHPDDRECLPGEVLACREAGYGDVAGRLQCNTHCTWDRRECMQQACGQPTVGGTVECDPGLEGDTTCDPDATQPHQGTRCNETCEWVEVECPWCGDGVRNGIEMCGPRLTIVSCDDIDGYFGDGALACDGLCRVDPVALAEECDRIACGDGVVSEGEVCDLGDGAQPSLRHCPYGLVEPCRVCADCAEEFSATRYCGDGLIDPFNEIDCDPAAPRETWCGGLGAPPNARCDDCWLEHADCDFPWWVNGGPTGPNASDDFALGSCTGAAAGRGFGIWLWALLLRPPRRRPARAPAG